MKTDLCDIIAGEAKKIDKKAERTKRDRFASYEEKVLHIIDQNYKPKGLYYGTFDPAECSFIDTFVDENVLRRARIDASSADDSLKKTVLFDTLIELSGARKDYYDISKMSLAQFRKYFALHLIEATADSLLKNPDKAGERLFDEMTSGKHNTQVSADEFYEFRRPRPMSELVAEKYFSLFGHKQIKEQTGHANNVFDLKYVLITDIYYQDLSKKAQERAMNYLNAGESKKAAVYSILQSIKKDLFF